MTYNVHKSHQPVTHQGKYDSGIGCAMSVIDILPINIGLRYVSILSLREKGMMDVVDVSVNGYRNDIQHKMTNNNDIYAHDLITGNKGPHENHDVQCPQISSTCYPSG